MSVGFKPVIWNTSKIVYDAILLAAVGVYLVTFLVIAPAVAPPGTQVDEAIRNMRAFGSLAFLMLTFILCIGPLARIDRRWLPLLYNRRHFGVLMCTVALIHASHVIGWYFAFSATDPYVALFSTNTSFYQLRGFPFELFGVLALFILCVLAATSHDFWLKFLGPSTWKALHMLVYVAYAAVVAHIAFGALLSGKNFGLAIVAAFAVASVTGLHIAAAWQPPASNEKPGENLIAVGDPLSIPEGRARIVQLPRGGAVAIFRHNATVSAVDNACAHQKGPLGEGCVIDGLITCPWHGYQYRLADGRSPPPFDEKIATYKLSLANGTLFLNPIANPPGTQVSPLALNGASNA